jgi:hypothetical protein
MNATWKNDIMQHVPSSHQKRTIGGDGSRLGIRRVFIRTPPFLVSSRHGILQKRLKPPTPT